MDIARTITTLRDPSFLEQVRSFLESSSPEADPNAIDATVQWIDGVRRDLADLLDLVGDPDDAAMVCAIKLLELQSHWITINTRLNYTAARGEHVDPVAAFRGTALSAMVDQLEQFLPARNVEACHAFLAGPLTSKAVRVLDDVWNDAVQPRPTFAPARKARGVASTTNRSRPRRLAA